jgi:hypothetical protein
MEMCLHFPTCLPGVHRDYTMLFSGHDPHYPGILLAGPSSTTSALIQSYAYSAQPFSTQHTVSTPQLRTFASSGLANLVLSAAVYTAATGCGMGTPLPPPPQHKTLHLHTFFFWELIKDNVSVLLMPMILQ